MFPTPSTTVSAGPGVPGNSKSVSADSSTPACSRYQWILVYRRLFYTSVSPYIDVPTPSTVVSANPGVPVPSLDPCTPTPSTAVSVDPGVPAPSSAVPANPDAHVPSASVSVDPGVSTPAVPLHPHAVPQSVTVSADRQVCYHEVYFILLLRLEILSLYSLPQACGVKFRRIKWERNDFHRLSSRRHWCSWNKWYFYEAGKTNAPWGNQ